MYTKTLKYLERFIKKSVLLQYGLNLSPMYRRTTGKVLFVSEDLKEVKIKIPLSYKNSNYVGTIFGGSLFAATDPFFMLQLLHLLGSNYVVWDKESTIRFKRPATEAVFASFRFSTEELEEIKREVAEKKEFDCIKKVPITNRGNTKVIAEVSKTIYIADKTYFKEKRKRRK